MLDFTKMNGAGNDFVLVDNRLGNRSLDQETIARVCDRHRGVGADGLIAVEAARNGADFRMRYYNRDGGEAEMCGNGARCFARYAGRLAGKSGESDAISFETPAGIISATFVGGNNVRLAMSEPTDLRPGLELGVEGTVYTAHCLNTGVPHAVLFVEDLENTPVQTLGAAVRYHDAFAPRGTNVNFARETAPGSVAIRTYERGVEGETLACGTGVVATALLYHKTTGAPSPVAVCVRGGETLHVGFETDGENFRNVTLTGPADFVFEGQIEAC